MALLVNGMYVKLSNSLYFFLKYTAISKLKLRWVSNVCRNYEASEYRMTLIIIGQKTWMSVVEKCDINIYFLLC